MSEDLSMSMFATAADYKAARDAQRPVRIDGDPEGYQPKFGVMCVGCALSPYRDEPRDEPRGDELADLCVRARCYQGARPELRSVIYIREVA